MPIAGFILKPDPSTIVHSGKAGDHGLAMIYAAERCISADRALLFDDCQLTEYATDSLLVIYNPSSWSIDQDIA